MTGKKEAKIRKCTICGRRLSKYNRTKQCHKHSVSEDRDTFLWYIAGKNPPNIIE